MGVPGLLTFLKRNFPSSFESKQSKSNLVEFDHIMIDLNGIIHRCVRKGKTEAKVIKFVFRELDALFKTMVLAKKSVFIGVDGPCSIAKLLTQRLRRRANMKITQNKEEAADKAQSGNTISSVEVTPGTLFMNKLMVALEYWAISRLSNDKKFASVKIVLSNSNVPGEGETKLIDYMRNAVYNSNDSFVLIGPDSDLSLLALVAPIASKNVSVFFTEEQQFFSVAVLCQYLEQLFGRSSVDSVQFDFVFLALLQGNDYLPKMRGADLHKMWRKYTEIRFKKKTQSFLRPNRTINWAFVLEVMGATYSHHRRANGSATAATTSNGGSAADDDAELADVDDNDESILKYQYTSEELSSKETPVFSCERYVYGLLWCFNMFSDGVCPDYRWHYNAKYAPTFSQLSKWVYENPQRANSFKCAPPKKSNRPLCPAAHAVAILPSAAKKYLASELHTLFDPSGPLSEYYNDEGTQLSIRGSLDKFVQDVEKSVSELAKDGAGESLQEPGSLQFGDMLKFWKRKANKNIVLINDYKYPREPPVAGMPPLPTEADVCVDCLHPNRSITKAVWPNANEVSSSSTDAQISSSPPPLPQNSAAQHSAKGKTTIRPTSMPPYSAARHSTLPASRAHYAASGRGKTFGTTIAPTRGSWQFRGARGQRNPHFQGSGPMHVAYPASQFQSPGSSRFSYNSARRGVPMQQQQQQQREHAGRKSSRSSAQPLQQPPPQQPLQQQKFEATKNAAVPVTEPFAPFAAEPPFQKQQASRSQPAPAPQAQKQMQKIQRQQAASLSTTKQAARVRGTQAKQAPQPQQHQQQHQQQQQQQQQHQQQRQPQQPQRQQQRFTSKVEFKARDSKSSQILTEGVENSSSSSGLSKPPAAMGGASGSDLDRWFPAAALSDSPPTPMQRTTDNNIIMVEQPPMPFAATPPSFYPAGPAAVPQSWPAGPAPFQGAPPHVFPDGQGSAAFPPPFGLYYSPADPRFQNASADFQYYQ